jgi:hypothetical protein
VTSMGARVWPWVPAGLLGSMLTGLGTLAVIATNDPGFALERDYYRKAVSYDQEIAQREENARLAWRIDATLSRDAAGGGTTLFVSAEDARGPVTGARVTVEALENAHAATVLDLTLVESSPGRYRVLIPAARGGLWELRVRLSRGDEVFTRVIRDSLPGDAR